jgi:hypothetical protein
LDKHQLELLLQGLPNVITLPAAEPETTTATRNGAAHPHVRLHRAMELIRRKLLPQGLLGQAIDYTLKRWEPLTRFITGRAGRFIWLPANEGWFNAK